YPNRANFLSPLGSFARRSSRSGLEAEIDRLFESAFSNFSTPAAARQVPVDVYEDKENSYVRVELPGVERDAINIELADGYLNLSANRKSKNASGEESFSVKRSISVPETVRADKVSAVYENGMLLITLPKQEQAKPRKIAVAVN